MFLEIKILPKSLAVSAILSLLIVRLGQVYLEKLLHGTAWIIEALIVSILAGAILKFSSGLR